MARRDDLAGDVSEAMETTETPRHKAEYHAARRVQALSFRLAGLTYAQIGERLGIDESSVRRMIQRSMDRSESNQVDEMRGLENERFDKVQSAIWADVLRGDLKAIDTFLKISKARREMNGMNAPQKVDISMSVRQEMEQAFTELENLVLEGELVQDDALEGTEVHAITTAPERKVEAEPVEIDDDGDDEATDEQDDEAQKELSEDEQFAAEFYEDDR